MVAAADEYMAGSINSSLIQSVQNSTALARCLGVRCLLVHHCTLVKHAQPMHE